VSNDRRRLFLEFRNGQVVTVDSTEELEFDVDNVVLVRAEDNQIEAAPSELWPEESWVGVVRLRHPDTTVVDQGGRLVMLPTRTDIDYQVGNTVEANNLSGVVRILSPEPIRYIDLPAIDDASVEQFVSQPSAARKSFEEFGGLREVVSRARELIEVPLRHREALAKIGARPIKGVLFTGPPGTGKTMLARIIADVADAKFYEISGPEIFSKWYGQSEELLRKLFAHAAAQSRAIIFFDEIDSVAAQRADEAHEATRRVVAQLLTLMDGFNQNTNVVVIATTNRPQDIDVALRRPGRFDWEIHFSLPTEEDRETILEISARAVATYGDLPHGEVAKRTASWSSADLTAIWSEAALLAVADGRDSIRTEDYFGGFQRVSEQRLRIANDIKGSSEVS